jgi:hypothetical protein
MQAVNNLPAGMGPDTPLSDVPTDYTNPRIDMVRAAAAQYKAPHLQEMQARIAETGGRFLVVIRKPKFGWTDYDQALLLGAGRRLLIHLCPAIEHWGANMLKKFFKLVLREAMDADQAEGRDVETRQKLIQQLCKDAHVPFEFKKEADKHSGR